MVTATELAYIIKRSEAEGLRRACEEVKPRAIGATGSPAFKRLMRALDRARDECAEAWGNLSQDQRDAVIAAERRAASVVL